MGKYVSWHVLICNIFLSKCIIQTKNGFRRLGNHFYFWGISFIYLMTGSLTDEVGAGHVGWLGNAHDAEDGWSHVAKLTIGHRNTLL